MILDDFCLLMCSVEKFSDNDLTDSGWLPIPGTSHFWRALPISYSTGCG